MGNYIIADNELYHHNNICHVDLDEDELIHWKYIKKIKLPNGKWRYYYNQSELDKYKQAAYDSVNARKDAKSHLNFVSAVDRSYEREMSEVRADVVKSNYTLSRAQYDRLEEVSRMAAKTSVARVEAKKNYEKLVKDSRKHVSRYVAKAVSAFPERTISRGAVFVGNLLNKRR